MLAYVMLSLIDTISNTDNKGYHWGLILTIVLTFAIVCFYLLIFWSQLIDILADFINSKGLTEK